MGTTDILLGCWQDDDGDGIVDDGEICSETGGTACTESNWTPIGLVDSEDNKYYPFRVIFRGRPWLISAS